MSKCVVLFSRTPSECAWLYARQPHGTHSIAGLAPASPGVRPYHTQSLQYDRNATTCANSIDYCICNTLCLSRRYLDPPPNIHLHLARLADRPRVITVNCEPSRMPVQGACPTPLIQGHFPGGQANSFILTQGLNGEPLRFPLQLWYSPGALAANGPINQAIFRITSGAAAKPWCGPVVVLKYSGSRRQGYADAGSNDLPALSAYFLAYR
jgi:hypothetical protein